jgi:hypothetical protein
VMSVERNCIEAKAAIEINLRPEVGFKIEISCTLEGDSMPSRRHSLERIITGIIGHGHETERWDTYFHPASIFLVNAHIPK